MESKGRLQRFLCCVMIISTFTSSHLLGASEQDEHGCTAPLLLPDLPFFVVWNHPSGRCESHGIHLGFEKWGIVDNEKDHFFGSKISLFYGGPWRWPHIRGKNTPVDGGIPQLGNLTLHLVESMRDVAQTESNKNFTGLNVIDFEYWRPLFRLNYDSLNIYQQMSLDLTKRMYPNLNDSMLRKEATLQFNKAARLFVEETLKELTSLRPYGKWGYYGYPRLYGSNKARAMATNDEMGWVFNHSTGFYPSIYFQLTKPEADRAKFIKKKLRESLRLKAKFSRHDTVIFPYANSQNGPFKTFNESDLKYAIGLPANLGASGVVLWGSSASMKAKNECQILQDYINSTLGPYVKNLTSFFSTCSQQLCEGHGRCVQKYHEEFYQRHLEESGRTNCRIPKEQLKRKKKDGGLDAGDARDSKTSSDRNSLKSFYDVIIKRPIDKSHYFSGNEKFKIDLQGKSFSLLTNGMAEDGQVLKKKGNQMSGSGQNQNVVNFSILDSDSDAEGSEDAMEEDSEDEINENDTFEFELPNDFDDYVCKCFAGWGGTHCRQKH